MNSKNLTIILIILIILLLSTLFSAYKYKCDNDAKRFYKQGFEFYQKEKYQDAYYNFKQIKRSSNLYELSLLKQFQCANYLSDKKTAHIKIKELAKLTREESLRPYVLYNEANLALELEKNSNSKNLKKFKYINKNYPESDFGIASAYKIAKLTQDNALAKEKYVEYLFEAPNGKYAQAALLDLAQNKTFLTKEDKEIIAEAYLLNQNYQKALELYKDTDFSSNWIKIAKCYRGLNKKDEEKSIIIKGLELNKSDVDEKELSSTIDRLANLLNAGKFQLLQALYSKYPNSYATPTIAYKLAQNSSSIRSIKFYEFISRNYPDSIWVSNSMWEVFWYNYKLSRFQVCEKIAQNHSKLYPKTQDAPRIAYWGAKALLREKKHQQAREEFQKILKDYPLSYYAFLSTKQLKSSRADKIIFKKPIVSYSINSIDKYFFKDKILSFLAQNEDFQTIDELKINNDFIKSRILYKKQNYPLAITTAKNALDEKIADNEIKIKYSDYELKLMYPVLYEKEINKYAAEFKQSPYLFLSLIREESHFDKNAKSSVGALGLAQIMPDTANFIEKTQVPKEALLDKDMSIKTGLKYFSYLKEDFFNQDDYLSILAYNAGPGNINKWMNDPLVQSNDIDAFVENIPYIETKNYIKKILSSYWVYINIYSSRNRG